MRRSIVIAGFACIVILVVLSLLPARDMIRTGAPKGVEHFIAYFLSAAILSAGIGRKTEMRVAVGLVLLSGLMEGLQHFSPGRTPHLSDFVASSGGAAAGALAVAIWLTWHRPARSLD